MAQEFTYTITADESLLTKVHLNRSLLTSRMARDFNIHMSDGEILRQTIYAWLAQEQFAGRFMCRRYRRDNGEFGVWFGFSDQNTAFAFKMRWG